MHEDGAFIFGRQALPPRYAFGYWFCRYWAYTDRDLEELVEHHNRLARQLVESA